MQTPLRAIAIALAIHSLWGGNPVAIKFSLEVFPPLWTAFFRFCIGVACLYLWANYKGVTLRPQPGEWPVLLLLGAVFAAQIATMNLGIALSGAAIASILISTNPLFAAGFAHVLVPGDRLTRAMLLGLTVAMAGTLLTLLHRNHADAQALWNWGSWIMLFSAMLLGARLAYSARSLRRIDAVRLLVWQMTLSLPIFAVGGYYYETIEWSNLSWAPVAGIAYQGLIIAGLGFMVTSYLMKRYRPSVMMSFSFVSPVVGVLLSVWLLGENVTWQLMTGMLTVGMGLYLIAR